MNGRRVETQKPQSALRLPLRAGDMRAAGRDAVLRKLHAVRQREICLRRQMAQRELPQQELCRLHAHLLCRTRGAQDAGEPARFVPAVLAERSDEHILRDAQVLHAQRLAHAARH